MKRSPAAGFTLIEVLVALVIVAFGMGALLATLSTAADTAGMLRDKSFAQWIAMNRITELRLRSDRPAVGKASGEVEFAGQKWRWFQEILDPGIAGMLRIDVSVVRASAVTTKDPAPPALALATGFIGTAVASSAGNVPDWTSASRPSPPSQDGQNPPNPQGSPNPQTPPRRPAPGTGAQ